MLWTGSNPPLPVSLTSLHLTLTAICTARNTALSPVPSFYGFQLDYSNLGANCLGSLTFPYDSMSTRIHIEAISGGGGNPNVTLTNVNGERKGRYRNK